MDDSLFAEVIAHPEDDGVRAVLADLLQAEGDPRGELISLQLLASRGNRERDDRIRELLETHGKSWLGSLRDAARACRFDRGFPSRLALASTWEPDDPRWDVAIADPVFATVEELLPGTARGAIYRRFLTSPQATNLRRVEIYDRGSLAGLADSTAPIRHVAFQTFQSEARYRARDRERENDRRRARGQPPLPYEYEADDPDELADFFDRLWAIVASHPRLVSLGMPAAQLPAVFQQRWYPRIRALVIGGGSLRHQLSTWDDLGQRHLTLMPSAALEPCERHYPWDYKVELVPEPDGSAIARISGEWITMPLGVLEALPREVRLVEIEHTSPLISQRIRDHLVRPGLEVVEVPLRADNFAWEIR